MDIVTKKNKRRIPGEFNLYYQAKVYEDVLTYLSTNEEYKKFVVSVHRKKILHLLSHIYSIPIRDHNYEDRLEFVFIHSKFMRDMYGADFYADILKVLLQSGVIEKSPDNYIVGKRTNSYRIAPQYQGLDFTVEKCDRKLLDRYFDGVDKKNDKKIPANYKKEYAKLKATFKTIKIDFEAAKDYLLQQFRFCLENPRYIKKKKQKNKAKGKNFKKVKLTPEQVDKMSVQYFLEISGIAGEGVTINANFNQQRRLLDQYQAHLMAITKIYKGGYDLHFAVDKAGRIHTNLTSLPRELRQFIRLDGQHLIGRDLVSSQPVFLACLLLNKYKNKSMPEDMQLYIRLCLNGGKSAEPDIYRYIMQRNDLTDREAFKKVFYEKIFFGKIPKETIWKVTKVFMKEFPSVWEFILEQKKDDYKQLAHNLQKQESTLFVGAAGDLMKKGIKVLTLHDALYIHAEHQELTDQIILSRFYKKYGVTPTISN